MINIIGRKWLYFIFSGVIIIPGIISLIVWGLRPAIDFTGGTLIEIKITNDRVKVTSEDVKKIIDLQKLEVNSIRTSGDNSYLIRLKPINKDQNQLLQEKLTESYGKIEELRFETVGPSVGRETTLNALKSVLLASFAIIIYIALAFRQIPKPYSSWKFGICAVLALMHDVLVVVGIFSILGHFFKVEIDSLFITALLTVMGFSVHDTIVVFDRIRENLKKISSSSFSHIVNESMVQTLARSLSTSMTVVYTLVALLLFGGDSIRWFIVTLLIGIISGTYSSIFNAAPLLVVWEEYRKNKKS